MPPLGELIDGRASLKLIREVSMTDIIGREEVRGKGGTAPDYFVQLIYLCLYIR